MKSKTIVGVCGFARSGKDTVGGYLIENHGFQKISFAKLIKDICRMTFDFSEEQLYGSLKDVPDERYPFEGICVRCGTAMDFHPARDSMWSCPSCGWDYNHHHITPRLPQQTLGTEWGRRLMSGIWTMATFNHIAKSDHDKWVIPDVRFRNEIQAIQDRGGEVIRLLRGEAQHTHQSEQEMAEMANNEFDWVIDNQGTLEELYENVEKFLTNRPLGN